jgi:hypothetical protein
MLQALAGVVLCASDFRSTLLSQEPLRAPKPHAKEPEQEFEPVDPHSAEIPLSWLANVPVSPVGLGIRTDDVPAYFRILEHVQNVPPENLTKAEREFRLGMIEKFGERTRTRIQREVKNESERKRVLATLEDRMKKYREDPFSYELVRDAFNQAKTCQGHVVSFSGHARRPRSFPAGENDYGFDQLYEIWVFDEDSNHYPVIVVCTELPEHTPVNIPDKEVLDGVSVRGYFFKLYAYEGGEKYHAIPMILARTVEWDPPETVSRRFPPWAYVLVIVAGIVTLSFIVWTGRSRKPLRTAPEPEDNPFQ